MHENMRMIISDHCGTIATLGEKINCGNYISDYVNFRFRKIIHIKDFIVIVIKFEWCYESYATLS